MNHVCVTRVGGVLIVHRDDPCDEEAKRRVQILLMGRLPLHGVVEAWPGNGPDEVRWRRVAS